MIKIKIFLGFLLLINQVNSMELETPQDLEKDKPFKKAGTKKLKFKLDKTIEVIRKIKRISFSGEFIILEAVGTSTIQNSFLFTNNFPVTFIDMWDLEENKLVESSEWRYLSGSDGHLNHFDTKKHIIIDNSHPNIQVISDTTYNVICELPHSNKIKKAKFNYDGNKVVSITEDGKINIWNSSSGQLLKIVVPENKFAKFADLTSDNKILITVLDKKILEFYNLKSGNLLRSLKFKNKISCFALNNNDSLLAIAVGQKLLIYKITK